MASSTSDGGFKTLSADDIDHTVTEIESCCMNCFENVSHNLRFYSAITLLFTFCLFLLNFKLVFILYEGNDSNVTHEDSILQGDSHHVIRMRTLWL